MATKLRPDLQEYDEGTAVPPTDLVFLAAAFQPVPDQRQSVTIIRVPIILSIGEDETGGEYTFTCWSAGYIGADLNADARQISGTYTIGLPSVAAMGTPITWPAELIFVDTAAQQSGAYMVARDDASGGFVAVSSPDLDGDAYHAALTTIGP